MISCKIPKLSNVSKHDSDEQEKPETPITEIQKPKSSQQVPVNLRHFKKIPIFIVDYHNDVLLFIYRAIANRFLPFNDNVLIHFDSHPDMVIDSDLEEKTCSQKNKLLDQLSIENWIMPACYTGQFGRIIWLKNSWAKQFVKGQYEFSIGTIDNKLGVDMPHNYFIAEGNYYPTDKLKNSRRIKFDVCEMDTENVDATTLLDVATDAKRCILDIDLDYFSTNNPFLDIYPLANCYEQLREIFKYECMTDLVHTAEKRRRQLLALKNVFEHLQEKRKFRAEFEIDEVLPTNIVEQIEVLKNSICEHYAESTIDWLLIYNAGCTTDNNGLPHHPSTRQELEVLYERFENFLKSLPFPPICITIATSIADNYTPTEQMVDILNRVYSILSNVFDDKLNAKPIQYDGTEDFNILKL